jgi:peroxiredoxin
MEESEVREGSVVPDFRLQSSTGDEIGVGDYREKAHLVLFFVREYS